MLTKEQYYKMVEVRKHTGCGLMYAKRALELSDWDIEKAIIYLEDNFTFWHPGPK